MASENDLKISLSIIKDVEGEIKQQIGNQIAIPFTPGENNFELAHFCEDMVKKLEIAENKSPNEPEILLKSNLLKAQLYGNWQKGTNMRGVHNKARECYEKALENAGDDKEWQAEVRYRYALFNRVGVGGSKEKVIENFEKVIELVGIDHELGMESAKELEIEKTRKSKGCFIVTAACGNVNAPEVVYLSLFRDKILNENFIGRLLVKIYYHLSPPIAQIVEKNYKSKTFIRKFVIKPIINIIKHFNIINQGKF